MNCWTGLGAVGDGQGWLLIYRIGDDVLILMLVRTEACLANESSAAVWENCTAVFLYWSKAPGSATGGILEGHLFYFRSINPMIEKSILQFQFREQAAPFLMNKEKL